MHIKMREAFQLRLRARICRSDECSAIRRCFVPDGDAKRLIRPTESREHTCSPDKRSAIRRCFMPDGDAKRLIRPTESREHICRPDKRSAFRRCFMSDGDAKRLIRLRSHRYISVGLISVASSGAALCRMATQSVLSGLRESQVHICRPDKRSAIRRCFMPDGDAKCLIRPTEVTGTHL